MKDLIFCGGGLQPVLSFSFFPRVSSPQCNMLVLLEPVKVTKHDGHAHGRQDNYNEPCLSRHMPTLTRKLSCGGPVIKWVLQTIRRWSEVRGCPIRGFCEWGFWRFVSSAYPAPF